MIFSFLCVFPLRSGLKAGGRLESTSGALQLDSVVLVARSFIESFLSFTLLPGESIGRMFACSRDFLSFLDP